MAMERQGPDRAPVLKALMARRGLSPAGVPPATGFVRLSEVSATPGSEAFVKGVDLELPQRSVDHAVRRPAYVPPGDTRIENTRKPPTSLADAVGDWPQVTIAGGDRDVAGTALFSLLFPELESSSPKPTWVLDLSRTPDQPKRSKPPEPEDPQEHFSIADFLTDQAERRGVPHDSRVVRPSEMLTVPAATDNTVAKIEILLRGLAEDASTEDFRSQRYQLERIADIVDPPQRPLQPVDSRRPSQEEVNGDGGNTFLSKIRAGLGFFLDSGDPSATILSEGEKRAIRDLEGAGEGGTLRKTSLSAVKMMIDAVCRTDEQQMRRDWERGQEDKAPMASPDGNDPLLRYHRAGDGNTDSTLEGNMMLAAVAEQMASVDDPTERVFIVLDDTQNPDAKLLDRLAYACWQNGRQMFVYRSEIPLNQREETPIIRPWSAFVSLGVSAQEAALLSPQFGYKPKTEYTQTDQARIGEHVIGDDVDPGRFIVATALGTHKTGPILPVDNFSTFLPSTIGVGEAGGVSRQEWKNQPGYRELTPTEARLYLDWCARKAVELNGSDQQ